MSSSPSHDSGAPLMLTLDAHNPATELFVVDSEFALVGRGLHRLRIKLPPGLYKVKARLGLREWEQHFALEKSKRIEIPPIEFASAVPLSETSRTHETHIDLAVMASRECCWRAGTGARIFVMSRQWAHAPSSASMGSAEDVDFRHVRLRRWRGDAIVDFRRFGCLRAGHDSAVAGCIEVNEGTYLLEFDTPQGTHLQTIFARDGWQTQAFILHDSANIENGMSTDLSIHMTRGSFEPSDPFMLATDAARIALAQEHLVASDELMVYAKEKFKNPILGIVSAHLLLFARNRQQQNLDRAEMNIEAAKKPPPPTTFRQELYDEIVHNTCTLLGPDQPDVVALALHSNERPHAVKQIRVPPMFWESWQMLVEASNDTPELIPESLWRRVANATNLRPYFSWRESSASSLSTYKAAVRDLSETLAGRPDPTMPLAETGAPSRSATGKPTLDELKDWATRGTAATAAGRAAPEARGDDLDALKRQMTKQLNIPRGMLDRTFDS